MGTSPRAYVDNTGTYIVLNNSQFFLKLKKILKIITLTKIKCWNIDNKCVSIGTHVRFNILNIHFNYTFHTYILHYYTQV
jgi:hypothetical protein